MESMIIHTEGMTVFTPLGKEYPGKWKVFLQLNMLNTSKKNSWAGLQTFKPKKNITTCGT
jgi:hypothetical protein